METIPLANLALSFLPVAVVVGILHRWSMATKVTWIALIRMVVQLLAVGYVLAYVFESENAAMVFAVLAVMLTAATWISLSPLPSERRRLFGKAFWAIAVGGVLTLALVTQGVLQVDPWFAPRQLITLAGMIFANSMNTLSIAAERYLSETGKGLAYEPARNAAMRAALIPLTNTLLAVGIVSLPGMMTGQILAGESPLVAARYQIMVMSMVYGSGGISAAYFLAMLQPKAIDS
jgi:putative ABC transport system permease protein